MLVTELLSKDISTDVLKRCIPLFEDYLSSLSQEDYECLYDDIYAEIYGEILSNEKAKKLVQTMKPYGEHYSIDNADKLIEGNKYHTSSKYYVLNMMYNDYHEMFAEDDSKYIQLTKLWLNDVDSDGGDVKTYRYAIKV